MNKNKRFLQLLAFIVVVFFLGIIGGADFVYRSASNTSIFLSLSAFLALIAIPTSIFIDELYAEKNREADKAKKETGKRKKGIYRAIKKNRHMRDGEKETLTKIVIPQLSSLGFLHILKPSDINHLDSDSIERLKLVSQNGLLVKSAIVEKREIAPNMKELEDFIDKNIKELEEDARYSSIVASDASLGQEQAGLLERMLILKKVKAKLQELKTENWNNG